MYWLIEASVFSGCGRSYIIYRWIITIHDKENENKKELKFVIY